LAFHSSAKDCLLLILGRIIAVIGSLLTILQLAIGPFVQQIIQ